MEQMYETLGNLQKSMGNDVLISVYRSDGALNFAFRRISNGKLLSQTIRVPLGILQKMKGDLVEKTIKTQLSPDWSYRYA